MRKIVVTFTIALSLGAASTIANVQPAAPAANASAAAFTTAATNNNQTTATKTSTPAAAQNSAPASSSAQVVVPPKDNNKSDKNPSDKDKQGIATGNSRGHYDAHQADQDGAAGDQRKGQQSRKQDRRWHFRE